MSSGSTLPTRRLVQALLVVARRHTPARAARALAAWLARRGQRTRWPTLRAVVHQERLRLGAIEIDVGYPVSQALEDRLRAAVRYRWPDRSVTIQVRPAVLGGFRLHAGTTTIDHSLSRLIEQLRQTLEVSHGN